MNIVHTSPRLGQGNIMLPNVAQVHANQTTYSAKLCHSWSNV